jgi:integrase
MDRRAPTILTGERGKPFTVEGFKSVWGREMDQVRLQTRACDGLVFHGLRKSAVCCMLEAGCSVEQVQAITGQSRQMVYHYAAELDRKRLGEQAMAHWEKQPGFVVQTPTQNTKTEA